LIQALLEKTVTSRFAKRLEILIFAGTKMCFDALQKITNKDKYLRKLLQIKK